jgi:HEAT repeat protein
VRAAAADVIGNLAPVARSAVPTLNRSLGDENVWVRRNAAEALGNIGDVGAVSALTGALTDDDWRIRFNSAFALAKIGPAGEEAVSALGKLVRDENRYVRCGMT